MDEIRKILDKHRHACQFYLKVDFGLLAGAASIFTILRLERIEIFRTVFGGRLVFSGIIVLICYGLIFDRWALARWSAQELSKAQQKAVLFRSKHGITAQLFLHIFFILSVFAFILGYSGGFSKGYDSGKAMISIQIGIEQFKIEKKVFPITLEDLVSRYPYISKDIRQLGQDNLQYVADERRGYILRYAGYDGKLGTKDDIVEDHASFIEGTDYPAPNKTLKGDAAKGHRAP